MITLKIIKILKLLNFLYSSNSLLFQRWLVLVITNLGILIITYSFHIIKPQHIELLCLSKWLRFFQNIFVEKLQVGKKTFVVNESVCRISWSKLIKAMVGKLTKTQFLPAEGHCPCPLCPPLYQPVLEEMCLSHLRTVQENGEKQGHFIECKYQMIIPVFSDIINIILL